MNLPVCVASGLSSIHLLGVSHLISALVESTGGNLAAGFIYATMEYCNMNMCTARENEQISLWLCLGLGLWCKAATPWKTMLRVTEVEFNLIASQKLTSKPFRRS